MFLASPLCKVKLRWLSYMAQVAVSGVQHSSLDLATANVYSAHPGPFFGVSLGQATSQSAFRQTRCPYGPRKRLYRPCKDAVAMFFCQPTVQS